MEKYLGRGGLDEKELKEDLISYIESLSGKEGGLLRELDVWQLTTLLSELTGEKVQLDFSVAPEMSPSGAAAKEIQVARLNTEDDIPTTVRAGMAFVSVLGKRAEIELLGLHYNVPPDIEIGVYADETVHLKVRDSVFKASTHLKGLKKEENLPGEMPRGVIFFHGGELSHVYLKFRGEEIIQDEYAGSLQKGVVVKGTEGHPTVVLNEVHVRGVVWDGILVHNLRGGDVAIQNSSVVQAPHKDNGVGIGITFWRGGNINLKNVQVNSLKGIGAWGADEVDAPQKLELENVDITSLAWGFSTEKTAGADVDLINVRIRKPYNFGDVLFPQIGPPVHYLLVGTEKLQGGVEITIPDWMSLFMCREVHWDLLQKYGDRLESIQRILTLRVLPWDRLIPLVWAAEVNIQEPAALLSKVNIASEDDGEAISVPFVVDQERDRAQEAYLDIKTTNEEMTLRSMFEEAGIKWEDIVDAVFNYVIYGADIPTNERELLITASRLVNKALQQGELQLVLNVF